MKLLDKHRDGSKVSKRYNKVKTPYQRVMERTSIVESVKKALMLQYKSLDPVRILVEIEEKQVLLWQRAWVNADSDAIDTDTNLDKHLKSDVSIGSDKPSKIITLKRNSSHKLDQNLIESNSTNSFFRTTKRNGKYHLVKQDWVTRPDPFKKIKDEIHESFFRNPNLDAKTLFCCLQNKYPDQLKDGQLRLMQRRIKELRMKQVKIITLEIGIILEPETI